MNYYDYHVHSSFSGDCNCDMETMILNAIDKRISKICFTDHYDYDYPTNCDIPFEVDIKPYYHSCMSLKEQYKSEVDLLFGIEFGLQKHIYEFLANTAKAYPFDFIIASIHVVNRLDPYNGDYYVDKTKREAYMQYLESILDVVTNYNDYDVLGHIDYIIRYGNYTTKTLSYLDFSEIIDAILIQVIKTGHGIEINTSGYRNNLNQPHPNITIIKRYRELGGEIITIGSDAHKPQHLAYNFDIAYDILKNCGFDYITTFSNRKPTFIRIT